jgi:hypothetical protein
MNVRRTILSNMGEVKEDSNEYMIGILCLCETLDYLASLNTERAKRINVFDSVSVPNVSLKAYMLHVLIQLKTESMYIHICHAIVYVNRYIEKFKDKMHMNPYNVHRLALSAIILSKKQLEDEAPESLHFYSEKCGISSVDVRKIECELFHALRDNLFVSFSELVAVEKMAIEYYNRCVLKD